MVKDLLVAMNLPLFPTPSSKSMTMILPANMPATFFAPAQRHQGEMESHAEPTQRFYNNHRSHRSSKWPSSCRLPLRTSRFPNNTVLKGQRRVNRSNVPCSRNLELPVRKEPAGSEFKLAGYRGLDNALLTGSDH